MAVNYANTNEGKQAQNIQTNLLPKIASSEFIEENDSIISNHKVIFQFKNIEPEKVLAFQKTLDEVLKSIRYYNLKSSVDRYNTETKFVIVHGFKNSQVAKTFDQLLTKEKKKKINAPYFAISSANYQIIQIHKNLDSYLNINNN